MHRSMVGLLAAAGAAMSAVVGLVHGDVVWSLVAGASTAVGLAGYLATPQKKLLSAEHPVAALLNTRRAF
jgi:hypothetical protein